MYLRYLNDQKITPKISIVKHIKIERLSVREINNCSLRKNEKKKPPSEVHLDEDRKRDRRAERKHGAK